MTTISALALAAEVDAALARVQESVAFLTSVAAVVYEQTKDSRRADDYSAASNGDYYISQYCNRHLTAIVRECEAGREAIANEIEERAEKIAKEEEYRVRQAEREALRAVHEAAKTAEHIPSQITLKDWHVVAAEGRQTNSVAYLTFDWEGVTYNAAEGFHKKTRAFIAHPDTIGRDFQNAETKEIVILYRAGMTTEEIGKAAFVQHAVREMLRGVALSYKKPRKAA